MATYTLQNTRNLEIISFFGVKKLRAIYKKLTQQKKFLANYVQVSQILTSQLLVGAAN